MPKRDELGKSNPEVDTVGNIFEILPWCVYAHIAVRNTETGRVEIINEHKPQVDSDIIEAQKIVTKNGSAALEVIELSNNESYPNVLGGTGFHTHYYEDNRIRDKKRREIFGI